jgi:hypothetical protein
MTKIISNGFYPVYRYFIEKLNNKRKVEESSKTEKTNDDSKN